MSNSTETPPEDWQTLHVLFAALRSTDLDSFSEKSGPLPASEASIDAMPSVEVAEGGKDCSVCLEELEIGSESREMPCKHGFHSCCIENWLKIHGSCPICRFVMPVKEEEESDGHEEESEGDQIGVLELILNTLLDDDGMDMDMGSDSDPDHNPDDNYPYSDQRQSCADCEVDGYMDMDFLSEQLDMACNPDEDELDWDELCGLLK